jgi:hypothetical protein
MLCMAKLYWRVSVFLQDAAPPAATTPAVPQPPTLQRLAPVAQKARPLVLTKAGRTENAVIRYQMFLRTVAKPGAVPATPESVTVSAIPCAWSVDSYLQREICFYSMTGLFACADEVTTVMRATDTGQTDLPVGTVCEVMAKPVMEAEERVIAALDRTKDQVFNEDYDLIVKPQLAKGGVVVTER